MRREKEKEGVEKEEVENKIEMKKRNKGRDEELNVRKENEEEVENGMEYRVKEEVGGEWRE